MKLDIAEISQNVKLLLSIVHGSGLSGLSLALSRSLYINIHVLSFCQMHNAVVSLATRNRCLIFNRHHCMMM
jgi:hypothetical protein